MPKIPDSEDYFIPVYRFYIKQKFWQIFFDQPLFIGMPKISDSEDHFIPIYRFYIKQNSDRFFGQLNILRMPKIPVSEDHFIPVEWIILLCWTKRYTVHLSAYQFLFLKKSFPFINPRVFVCKNPFFFFRPTDSPFLPNFLLRSSALDSGLIPHLTS